MAFTECAIQTEGDEVSAKQAAYTCKVLPVTSEKLRKTETLADLRRKEHMGHRSLWEPCSGRPGSACPAEPRL